jgi:AraC-like DNA-binding protein
MSVAPYRPAPDTRAPAAPPGQVTADEIWTTPDEATFVRAYPAHDHEHHELMWFEVGAGQVVTVAGSWALDAGVAVWVPARSVHSLVAAAGSRFHPVLISADLGLFTDSRWLSPHVVRLDPLAARLLVRLGAPWIDDTHRADLARVLHTLLSEAEAADTLRIPTSPRAGRVAAALLDDPASPRDLDDWARRLGVSTRTLSREFVTETGLRWTTWATRARVRAALPALRAGVPVERAAAEVGYRTTSGFIAAFREHMGVTPGVFARTATTAAGLEDADAGPGSQQRARPRRG